MKTPIFLAILALSLPPSLTAAQARQGFDLYLEEHGVSAEDWQALPQDRRDELKQQYFETLNPRAPGGEDEASRLRRLKNPDLLRSYMEGSRASGPYLDAQSAAAAVPGSEGGPSGPGAEAARAAGLDVLESLRPGAGGSRASAPAAPPRHPPQVFPKGLPVSLSALQSSSWGSELLSGLTREPGAEEPETLDGARLRVEYADLGPLKRRGDTETAAERGFYRVAIDEKLKGTEAEAATAAHELSHVRDKIDHPEARPETLGLLMEHRANLYEVAVYLDRHPDAARLPPPENFYDAELWFKARVYAGSVDKAMVEALGADGRLAQMESRAGRILASCKGLPCGGTKALYGWVVDPIYAGTREGNILRRGRETLPAELQLLWDDADAYDAETASLDRRVRERSGLEAR